IEGEFSSVLGYSKDLLLPIGVTEAICTLVFLIPRTAPLGGLLLMAYLGGATATHARIHHVLFGPIIGGFLVWLALYCRDGRVRELFPLKWVFLVLVLALGLMAYAITLRPSTFNLERSAVLSAPPSEVFAQVNELKRWQAWSPWAKLDPNAKNTYEGPEAG